MLFLALTAILALVSLPTPSTSQGDNIILPLTLPARVISNQQAVCPPDEVQEAARNETIQDTQNVIRNTIIPTLCLVGQTQAYPAASCSEIPTSCSSGYYWVRSSNGTAVQVYCETQRVCGCSNTTGWTRVASLNTSDESQQCPGDWVLQTYNSSEPRRLCGRGNSDAGCLSAVYDTYRINYSHVCGRVIGYGYNSPDAFGQVIGSQTIQGPYVDGVSLTHGPLGARQHIWTFAAGLFETLQATHPTASCPCVSGTAAPTFVGNDYFCESGNPGTTWTNILYASDPLWDSQGCGSPPCCELSSPPGVTAPWFCKQLPQATTDDLEVRICGDQDTADEDTPVELIELYIR